MAAIVASKVKRERQLREYKASLDANQHLQQRNSGKVKAVSQQDALQRKSKMMFYRKV